MNPNTDRAILLSQLYDKMHKPTPYRKTQECDAFIEGIKDCRTVIETQKPQAFCYQWLQDNMSKLLHNQKHIYTSKEKDAYEKGVLSAKSLVAGYYHQYERN